MAQAHVDPEVLRSFAQKLRSYAELIESTLQSTNGRLGHLSESWKDQEYETFKLHFDRTKMLLKKFTEETRKVTPLLERDAAAAEEYQRLKANL